MKRVFVFLLLLFAPMLPELNAQDAESNSDKDFLLRAGWITNVTRHTDTELAELIDGGGMDLSYFTADDFLDRIKVGLGVKINFTSSNGLLDRIGIGDTHRFYNERILLAPRLTVHLENSIENLEVYGGTEYQFRRNRTNGCMIFCGTGLTKEELERMTSGTTTWSNGFNYFFGMNYSLSPRLGFFTEMGSFIREEGSTLKAGFFCRL